MPTITEKLQVRLFPPHTHPHRIFEREIAAYLRAETVLLDGGCGRTAELLRKFAPQVWQCIGVDVVDFAPELTSKTANSSLRLLQSDLAHIDVADQSVDVAISRAVMEHLEDPASVYREIFRILKPGGYFVFLTPNLWDYGSLVAKLVPNRFHPWIVARTEGRPEQDTFPVYYRANTAGQIRKLARKAGFEVHSVRHLGQYPAYLIFNPVLFLIGATYEKVISGVPFLRFLRGSLLVVLRKRAAQPRQPAPL